MGAGVGTGVGAGVGAGIGVGAGVGAAVAGGEAVVTTGLVVKYDTSVATHTAVTNAVTTNDRPARKLDMSQFLGISLVTHPRMRLISLCRKTNLNRGLVPLPHDGEFLPLPPQVVVCQRIRTSLPAAALTLVLARGVGFGLFVVVDDSSCRLLETEGTHV